MEIYGGLSYNFDNESEQEIELNEKREECFLNDSSRRRQCIRIRDIGTGFWDFQ